MTEEFSGPPPALVRALRNVLRALVKLLIRYGITLPALTDLLKAVYVDVADREFPIDEKPQTDSRISVLTGVHRKDVRRLRNQTVGDHSVPRAVSIGAQVIATWVSDKRYCEKSGKAKPLPLRGDGRRKYSFEQLVTDSARQDLRPRVVLDELVRIGVVSVSTDDVVTLTVDALVPSSGFDEKAHYFGQNLSDHIAAAASNLAHSSSQTQAPFLERAVTYHELTDRDISELHDLVESKAMEALKVVNRRASQLKRANKGDETANNRMNFGAFYFHEKYDRHHVDPDAAENDED